LTERSPEPAPRGADEDLETRLRRVLEGARRTYAGWRAEVAAYLFEHAFRPTLQALPPHPMRAHTLELLWRLQMETIGTKMFGVSTDAWRDNPAYPDRFFPIVWIDLVPRLLPRLPPERWPEALVSLFNLGENLVIHARGVGAAVAEALARDPEATALDGVEETALAAMADLGLVPKGAVPGRRGRSRAFDRLVALPPIALDTFEPTFVPGLVLVEESAIVVADLVRPLALAFSMASAEPQLIERRTLPSPTPLPTPALPCGVDGDNGDEGRVDVDEHGRVTVRPRAAARGAPGERKVVELGTIDVRALASVAASAHGLLAVTRRFSQRLELYALRDDGGLGRNVTP
jgi:hypothetical protein